MNHQRLLRIFILTDVFCVVAGVIAAIVFEGTLPEPLRTHAATEELSPVLTVVALVLLVLLIAGWVGLWRRASWGPPVYAVMWVVCAVMLPFAGPHVGTGIEEMFDFVGTAAGGGILALLLIQMKDPRSSRGASPAGTEPASALWSEPGQPDVPDEPLRPNMKSWRVHRLMSWLYGLIALMMLALPFVAWAGEEEPRAAVILAAFTLPSLFFALAAFHHFVSRGAKERKGWARIGSIVLACLLLPGVPVGTIIGVYLLRNSSWGPDSAVAPAE